MVTTMTSREFNQSVGEAKRAAQNGPVIVTDRGRPDHVLLTYEAYVALMGGERTLADVFARLPDPGDVDVEFPRSRELPRPVEFD